MCGIHTGERSFVPPGEVHQGIYTAVYRIARPFRVVVIFCRQTVPGHRTICEQNTGRNGRKIRQTPGQGASLCIGNTGSGQFFHDPPKRSYGIARIPVVIPQQDFCIVGVGSDYGYIFYLFGKWEDPIILQQYHGFPCSFKSQGNMLLTLNHVHGNFTVWNMFWIVEHAQFKTGKHQSLYGCIYGSFCDQSLTYRFCQIRESHPAIQIGAGFDGQCGSLFRRFHYFMHSFIVEIFNGPAIRHDISAKTPFLP